MDRQDFFKDTSKLNSRCTENEYRDLREWR